jgi:hypothetical protein
MMRKTILILYHSNARMSGIERVGDVIKMIAPTKWRAGSSILRNCRDVPSRGIWKLEVMRVFSFVESKRRVGKRPMKISLFVSAAL